MKTDLKHIVFSIIFAFLFGIILYIELFEFISFLNSNNVLNMILSLFAIIISSVGIYVSIIYGVVKLTNKSKRGKRHGKKQKKES